jgi:predicted DNA repair protein MutK
MKTLTIVGTLAMFLVGGGIVVHGLPPVHHAITDFAAEQAEVVQWVLPTLVNLVLGFIVGALVVGAVKMVTALRGSGH